MKLTLAVAALLLADAITGTAVLEVDAAARAAAPGDATSLVEARQSPFESVHDSGAVRSAIDAFARQEAAADDQRFPDSVLMLGFALIGLIAVARRKMPPD